MPQDGDVNDLDGSKLDQSWGVHFEWTRTGLHVHPLKLPRRRRARGTGAHDVAIEAPQVTEDALRGRSDGTCDPGHAYAATTFRTTRPITPRWSLS